MGLSFSLILAVTLAVIAFIGVLVYAILDKKGFLEKWRRAKKALPGLEFPCIVDGDCEQYGEGGSYVCAPKIKQCRLRSYLQHSCTQDLDCLPVTSRCTLGVIEGGRLCTAQPYDAGSLYGDPGGGCDPGLILNQKWNFCQNALGSGCASSDECAQGACVNGKCQLLGAFDPCTDQVSYGNNQCGIGSVCTSISPYNPLVTQRCFAEGMKPRGPGSYCYVDLDCNDFDCYHADAQTKLGLCANRIGLIGMACKASADCAQGLECNPTSGTCVLLDPSTQQILKNCPTQYTTVSVNGCQGAFSGVPCSSDLTCTNGCGFGVANLVLGSLGPSQNWIKIYPPGDYPDIFGLFSEAFTLGADGKSTMNPDMTLLLSINAGAGGSPPEIYPTIVLTPPPPIPQQPPVVGDKRACQNFIGDGFTLYSSFSTLSSTNIIFQIQYNPTNITDANTQVKAIFINGGLGGSSGAPVQVIMPSSKLYPDFFVDANPYGPTPPAFTKCYVSNNYHGLVTDRLWNFSAGDSGVGGANIPTPWVGKPVYLMPPPLLPYATHINILQSDYLGNCLRLTDGNLPREVFSHFFFHPSADKHEVVISFKFMVMPAQEASGISTLVGFYEVERDATTSGQRARRLVISTLSLYISTVGEAIETAAFSHVVDSATTDIIYAYRRDPVYDDTQNSGANVYACVYSFVLIDFETNWPFTCKLAGPPPTNSDAGLLCKVDLTDGSGSQPLHIAETTYGTLVPDGNDFIPGWSLDGHQNYPVFTPRAFTRVQAATTIRNDQWNSINLFGSNTPSLLDTDLVIMGTAGASSIIGMLLVYDYAGERTPQTLILTMRFGDTMPTSRYSLNNLNGGNLAVSNRTKFYTFYLTPEPEETGGGIVNYLSEDHLPTPEPEQLKAAFPLPRFALQPDRTASIRDGLPETSTQNISSWATPPMYSPDTGTPVVLSNEKAEYVSHSTRTSWGIEVFTASLLPATLTAPVRFFRMPIAGGATALASNGSDDVWVWGRDLKAKGQMICVPLFFDNLGTIEATFPGKSQDRWVSTVAASCPPTNIGAEILLGQDFTYKNLDGPGQSYTFSSENPWGPPSAYGTGDVGIALTGRLCQTQGYQDGIIYRARPYAYPIPGEELSSLPHAIDDYLYDNSNIVPDSLQGQALALSSLPDHVGYRDALPMIGVGSIQALLKGKISVHPVLATFFEDGDDKKDLIWVGSESGIAQIPGGERTLPCPLNSNAGPTIYPGTFPQSCSDFLLTQQAFATIRKPQPICVIYRVVETGLLEVHLYDLRMNRENGQYSVQLLTNTIVNTNGASLAYMTIPTQSTSKMGYPGFNGGPALVYTTCTGNQ